MKCPISEGECLEPICLRHDCAEALAIWNDVLAQMGYDVAQFIGPAKIARENNRREREKSRKKKG